MNVWPNLSFATVLLFLILACASLLHGKNGRERNYLVFWLFTLAGLAAAPYYNSLELFPGHIFLQTAVYTLANLTPVSSALLIFLLFEEKNVSSSAFWGIAAVGSGLDSYDYWVSQPGNWPNDTLLILLFEYFPQLIKIGFLGLTFYALLKSWKADLVQKRFQMRFIVLIIAAAIGMEMLIVENLLALRYMLPFDPSNFHTGWQFLLAIWLVFTFLRPTNVNWASIRISEDSKESIAAIKKGWIDWDRKRQELDVLLSSREIYRDPELNLKTLATELSIPEYRARQLINVELGYKNLNDFLHDHRIAAAARDLADAEKQHLPILTIALDAGFSSLAPFNKAFKERQGKTPSEFRRSSSAN